jgi:hypothetical protein
MIGFMVLPRVEAGGKLVVFGPERDTQFHRLVTALLRDFLLRVDRAVVRVGLNDGVTSTSCADKQSLLHWYHLLLEEYNVVADIHYTKEPIDRALW